MKVIKNQEIDSEDKCANTNHMPGTRAIIRRRRCTKMPVRFKNLR